MNNHVHFLLTPTTPLGLAKFFSRLHTWWARFFNDKNERTGHLFQSRYHSSPLSESHYWNALRYVELNPVRAKLVKKPEEWIWSSARTHLQIGRSPFIPLVPVQTRAATSPADWRLILQASNPEEDNELRAAEPSSSPCGPLAFLQDLEARFHRRLTLRFAAGQMPV